MAAILLAAGGITVGLTRPFVAKSGPKASAGVVNKTYPTSLQTVTRRSLSSQTQVDATLGYAGSYSVISQASGTVTWLPAVGQVITDGKVLYRVDANPVVLLYGSTPAYRSLSAGQTGADVQELNAELVRLGYATSAQLSPTSDYFGSATTTALKKLQAALGTTQNGTVTLGQAVFLPTSTRVTSLSAQLGGTTQAGQTILVGSSTTRQVTINLDASLQSDVKDGDHVTITLPDGSTTPGVISYVGTVASSSSSGSNSGSSGNGSSSTPTVTVDVTPTNPEATGSLDQAPVQVAITTGTVNDALVVPISALVALSSGGYAVEIVDATGIHHLVDVTVGIIDDADSLAQISGPGLQAGQQVVVPSI